MVLTSKNIMKKIFLLLALFPVLAFSQLKINELMPKNISAVMDDAYNYSMWVEIYNSSSSTVNQNSYYFTDDLNNKKKWQPALKNIPGGGFSVLYFEGDASGHASFKLEPEGGTLYLLNGSGTIIDQVTYPRQFRNTSYGRVTDGTGGWGFFIASTPGASNNGSATTVDQCANPSFLTLSGFHSSNIDVTFRPPTDNDSIYYTTDATEPTRKSKFYTPGTSIPLTKTTVIRAQCFSEGKLASDIVSATFFIREREFTLPVSSVITDPKNLFDNTIGIYVDGTNGKPHDSVGNRPVNWAQNWSRPANYELFDTQKSGRLNQEVDIKIVGNWSRANAQKSLAINPKNKHGDNRLRYDNLFTAKPNLKYKSLMLRNSGNDWRATMMKDAALMSLVEKRMNIDCFAYEPAVIFINGEYYGIQNLRERGNEDFVFANYGFKEEEIIFLEEWDLPWNWEYRQLYEFIGGYNMANETNYNKALGMMDVDNFIDYMITEIYYANTDWPMKNIKTWKKIDGGKWRWVLYDLDLAFSTPAQNMLSYMLDFNASDINNSANKIILKGLLDNKTFKDDFLERFCYHISTTFDSDRVNHVIDSLSSKIEKEIVYHKQRWRAEGDWGFSGNIANMKTFGKERPDIMMRHLSERFMGNAPFYTLSVSSDNPEATYTYNNKHFVDRSSANLKVFLTQSVTVEALPVEGYEFDHWELMEVGVNELIANGSEWKYFDGGNIPAENWEASDYDDSSWSSGKAPLGYVQNKDGFFNKIATEIGYGGNNADKYPTSYYRKSFTIENLASKNDFKATIYVDDGAAVYVNGTEAFRTNLPEGEPTFNTYASGYAEITASFEIPKDLLVEGENVIAVEVHQCNATSSDVIFDFNVSNAYALSAEPIEQPVFEQMLIKNKSLRAIYKLSEVFEDPDKDMRVVINEVVSNNTKHEDADGEFDGYIELYNDSSFDVDISGWYLSDNPDNRTLSQIPEGQEAQTTIASKDRLILWADKQPEQGALHLNFSLSEDGATLLLSKYNYLDELVTVDQVAYPALGRNESYSRVPDGSDTWVVQPSTFNRDNEDVISVDKGELLPLVYPVWVDDYFTVANAGDSAVKLIGVGGTATEVIADGAGRVNASGLQPGLYLVVVGDKTFKIVKK